MPVDFLLNIPNLTSASACKAPPGMSEVTGLNNIRLYVNQPESVLLLPHGNGAIIGHLFSKSDIPRRIRKLDQTFESLGPQAQLRRLSEAFWGSYIAILHDPQSGSSLVARDPSGGLACLYMRLPEATLYTSRFSALYSASEKSPSIDWDGLLQHLYSHDLKRPETALDNIRELFPGFVSTVASGRVTEALFWSPWPSTFPVERQEPLDPHELAGLIKRTMAVSASPYRRLMLGVSGGLDSSVVAACLKDTPVTLNCFTIATDESEGDERPYASCLCEALGLPLTEMRHEMDDIDISISTSDHLPRPHGHSFGQSLEVQIRRYAKEVGASALFTGQGGDNVFCYMQSATPLLDRFLTEGVSAGTWRTLIDICRLTGCTIWEAAARAARRGLRFNSRYTWRGKPRFLNADALAENPPSLDHPWLCPPKNGLPGKAVHISLILRILGTLEPYASNMPPAVTPLLSQPIIETCLGMPSWVWCGTGQNRYPVRQAFAPDLPSAILNRSSKGGAFSFMLRVLAKYRRQLHEHLLDGALSNNDLLDRDAIYNVLSGKEPFQETDYLRISFLTEAESWARSMLSKGVAPVSPASHLS